MPIEMEEDYLSRSGSRFARKVKYVVTGTDDDGAVRNHVELNADAVHDGLAFQNITNIQQRSDMRWIVTCGYGVIAGGAASLPEPESGTASYSFSATVEPETFFYSAIASGPDAADQPKRVKVLPTGTSVPEGGLIGLQMADGRGRHAGITVPAGPITDEVTYEYPAVVIPTNYRNTVRGMIGGVNKTAWLGNQPGSMRLLSVRAQVTSNNKQTIAFGWGYRENKQTTVGEFNLGVVEGWDSVWTYDVTWTFTDPDGREVPIVEPKIAFVERLLKRVDFAGLGLPSF